MTIDRRKVHLVAGLTMLTYVVSHLINHAFLVVSIEFADAARSFLVSPWTNPIGTSVLATAVITHVLLALWTTYARRSLRMPVWQWTQLALGLSIPLLLISHAMATGGAILRTDVEPNYGYELAIFWHFAPLKGWSQFLLLIVAWSHACVGIHNWLKVHSWYPAWRLHFYGAALVVPTAALLGYAAGGFEVIEKLQNPLWYIQVLKDIQYPGPSFDQSVASLTEQWMTGYTILVVVVFVARPIRIYLTSRSEGFRATYPSGRRVLIPKGGTLLEASHAGGIPHPSICGGRGRCSTCRVLVLESEPGSIDAPKPVEQRVLSRLRLPKNVRLACQVRPRGNIKCEPLLPPDVAMSDVLKPDQFMHGQEMEIAVMFADLRGFTKMSEKKLPFDVVFLLNRYFHSMGTAIEGAGGQVDKFIGDGIMALFGVGDAGHNGADQALAAAQEMSQRLLQMNERLKNDLPAPLRIGIGIHFGHAIVGSMGHGEATQVTAIGDTVNTASRLEALTKEHDVQLLVSCDVEEASTASLDTFEQINVTVRGREEILCVRKIDTAGNLALTRPLSDYSTENGKGAGASAGPSSVK